ncbi:hypothetical protein [Glacieibacterium frigidum]|uniref:Uncharacterized protein n=1 Tax=Glacieibacterium frigidum TaxID=2593303 RepID=A0A552UH17_9SPHN|nr:hypothetical protein [Glacieibacterium frigidum]TRW17509.1 hypothetical protein FMM06_04945 [Glacieibacterium frigidum]
MVDRDEDDDDEEVELDPVVTVARITALEMMVGQLTITQLRILDKLGEIKLTPAYIRELADAYGEKVDSSTIIESSSTQVNYEFKLNVIHHLERFFEEMAAHLEANP